MNASVKKTVAIVTLVAAILAVTACWRGDLTSQTTITSKEGAGTRVFSVNVWKNGAKTPDGKILTDNEWDPDFETGHLKGSNAQIEAKLKAVAPFPGMQITTSETPEKRWFYMSFSFSSIDDYNAKLKAMFDAASPVFGAAEKLDLRGTFIPATLKMEGDKVTFTDSWQSSVIGMDWAWNALYADPELIVTGNLWKNQFLYLEPNKVKVGDTEAGPAPNGKAGIAFAELSPSGVNATYKVTGTIQ